MRTIKFRGKRIIDGEWIYGYYLVNRGEHFIVADEVADPFATYEDYQVDPETVGQFTGLYDSTGKEIYEGDIIKAKSLDSSLTPVDVIVYVVKYNEKKGTWVFSNNTPLYFVMDYYKIEEIGNIHDNPELIDQ